MPRKPKKPCGYPGCPELTAGRYCQAHQREMDRDYDKNNRPYKHLYKSARWQKLRKQVLNKLPLCVECVKINRLTPATVVDHIRPHEGDEELFYNLENLQPLCKTCHDRKTAKEDGRWGKKGRVYTY
ncbi:5-methylcytosine-specific restriction protein A [Desulfitispora alkaliphila]|uniref:HNH endonuclease signature motif containing protein n=1 Tax=Desulfitispora alkaliphila TaxID=622674 RepID=UPI003D23993D